jgi:biotin operon repressor
LHPDILYTKRQAAKHLAVSPGEVEYLAPLLGSEELLGKDILAMQETLGRRTTLYGVLQQTTRERDVADTTLVHIQRWHAILDDTGDAAHPFLENIGDGDPRYAAPSIAIPLLQQLMESRAFDRRSRDYEPSKVFSQAGDQFWSNLRLSRRLGIDRADVDKVIGSAEEHGIPIRSRQVGRSMQYRLADFLTAYVAT